MQQLFSSLHRATINILNRSTIDVVNDLSSRIVFPQSRNLCDERKLKVLHLELHILRQEGQRAPEPEFITENQWEHIQSLPSKSARRRYFSYLWQLEWKKKNKAVKKQESKQLKDQTKRTSFYHNSMLLRIYDTTINLWDNNRLIQAMLFGEKFVFDCSFDEYMTTREASNAAKQLMLSFANNRSRKDPFDLHLCNVDNHSTTMQCLRKNIPTLTEKWFPLNIHEECFTKVFPANRLVYLTPHCQEDLQEFNYNDIYVVGCIVDKTNSEPLSLAKAKKLNLRMARLPLDRHLQWGAGSGKSLTLDQMTNIMLDLKDKHDWKFALRHVPKRKILVSNDESSKSRSKNMFNYCIN